MELTAKVLFSVALLILGLGLMAWRLYRSEALLLVQDIAAGNGPSRFKQARPAPRHTQLDYEYAGRLWQAELYLPAQSARAAIVLVAGAAEQGQQDPRLVAFAHTLARAGFAVMLPVLNDIRQLRLRPDNAAEITAAFRALREHFLTTPLRCGMGAFSFASGPTLLAAMSAEIAAEVDFVIAIGGYYDIDRVLEFIVTGRLDGPGGEHIEPRPFTRYLMLLAHLELLPAEDAELIRAEIQRFKQLPESFEPAALRCSLGPEAQAMLDFITNTRPERVAQLAAALPAAVRSNLQGLNLARQDMRRLQAPLLVIHGRGDDMIPYTQGLALAQAAPHGRAYILHGLQHVDLRTGLRDGWVMWRAVRRILAQRQGRGDTRRP